ncbi:MAG: radical SAM protein, partial [Chloroflexi bacterium]|nr:radical SAM protein [Chloroflexota bacterium]
VIGCKLNQAEVEALARQALAAGHQVVQDPSQADWAIVNTCTVTHVAARKSRQAVRRLHRLNPAMRIAVIGCFAEISPSEAAHLEGVAFVLPNARKEEVLQEIASRSGEALAIGRPLGTGAPLPGGHTRALVKVQDGCDNTCTYCIVSTARGPSRSRPPEEVFSEVQARLQEGYREVVLTGVNLGAYGRDMGASPTGWSLARLVRALLDLPGDWRLRLSSIEPWDVTPELIALWPHPKLCQHLHVPLQSGSDTILRRMGRSSRA